MAVLRAQDTISGQEGKATSVINGNVELMMYIKKLEAIFNKEKVDVKTLGKRGKQSKTTGWSGTGDMDIYSVTSKFVEMAQLYVKEGKDTYFDITIVNEDETSSIGKQTVVLYNCNVDSSVIAQLDTDSQVLEQSMSLTFDDFEILDSFKEPTLK